ncbi:MAG: helix-turn-helix domain-containing protein, partial [Alphaproteobacteria bacterium]|nr:helix-turn-helix domain-containing protein [Alphaproteobacteria bacterium]
IVPSLLKKRQPLYTVPEAADILNVSEKTVRCMVEEGRLRHVEVGRLVRIAPADLDDFICGHRGP